MHPDDKSPYQSREQLFDKIKRLTIELDNKDDTIAALNERIRELQSAAIILPSELSRDRLEYLEDWDRYAESLPP